MVILRLLHRYVLLIVVFLAGAIILVLEVIAVRFLSIYFGNTIYTVSSVISVILFALSLGYFVGGRLADKINSDVLLYRVILIAGFAVLAVYVMNFTLVPGLGNKLNMKTGPLLLSFLLFFVPSFLLGTLSPIVTTLQNKKKKEGVGKTVGDVYFWSTLGSIAGSLTCGFILIPLYGLDRIVLDAGVILVVIGAFGLAVNMKGSRSKRWIFLLLIFVLLGCGLLSFLKVRFVDKNVVFFKDGVYSRISVVDGEFLDRPVRYLRQDFDHQSAIFLDTNEMSSEYTKFYSIYKLVNPNIKNALVIGGGAYSVPKALLNDNRSVRVDVVDIDEELLGIAKRYFGLKDDKRLKSYIGDGRRYLYDTKARYDFIFSDAFVFSVPFQFTTKEFFQLSKDRLKENGLFVYNIMGSTSEKAPSFTYSEIATFKSVYPNSYFFKVYFPLSNLPQNIILVGYNSNKKINFNSHVVMNDSFYRWISGNQIDVGKIDLSRYKVFVDNYAPVEYYLSQTPGFF